MPQDNGWGEYSRLVLKELETLASSIQALNSEIQELKQEIARMREREDRVDELRSWKDKVDEVASPSQLQVKFNEVEDVCDGDDCVASPEAYVFSMLAN